MSSLHSLFRYKQHKTDFVEIPSTRPILVPCRVSGCRCSSYHYVPLNGTQPIRCTCKHFADDHSESKPYKCLKGCTCKKFWSAFTCSCGNPAHSHKVSGNFSSQLCKGQRARCYLKGSLIRYFKSKLSVLLLPYCHLSTPLPEFCFLFIAWCAHLRMDPARSAGESALIESWPQSVVRLLCTPQ